MGAKAQAAVSTFFQVLMVFCCWAIVAEQAFTKSRLLVSDDQSGCGIQLMNYDDHLNAAGDQATYGPYTIQVTLAPRGQPTPAPGPGPAPAPEPDDDDVLPSRYTYTISSAGDNADPSFGCSTSGSPVTSATFTGEQSIGSFYIFCTLGSLISTACIAFYMYNNPPGGDAEGGFDLRKGFCNLVINVLSSLFIGVFLLPFTGLFAATQEGVVVGLFDIKFANLISDMFATGWCIGFFSVGYYAYKKWDIVWQQHAAIPVLLTLASYITLVIAGAEAQYTAAENFVEAPEVTISAGHTVGIAVVFSLNNIVLSTSSPTQPGSLTALSVIGLLKTLFGYIAAFVPE
jgi:hypothetical protein